MSGCGVWVFFQMLPQFNRFFTGDGVRSVRLLARYGESYPAWLRLRASGDAGGVVSARLDARLLTEMGRYAEADSVLARTALRGEDAYAHPG